MPTTPGEPVRKVLNLSGSTYGARKLHATSRTSAVVSEQSEVSFGAYFNAFAASYWRRWSILTEVHLRLDVEGSGRIDVYRTKADGSHIFEHGEVIEGPGRRQVEVTLDLRPFEDGGWYWFDLTTDATTLTVHAGGWYARCAGAGSGRCHRRHADVQPARRRRRDAHGAGLRPEGARHHRRGDRARPGHEEGARRRPASRRPPPSSARSCGSSTSRNLGGSGGYARIMYEALEHTDCEQILYMDDDILRRARLDPAGRRVLPLRAHPDAGRRPDAVAAGPLPAFHHGRGRRPQRLPVAQRPGHRAAPRPGRPHPAPDAVAAPPHRRRLQRVVDVPDPACGRRGRRHAAAAVHQVGRRRVRPARPREGLPHGHRAGHRDLAHVVHGEGRHQRLAGLLPLPQPAMSPPRCAAPTTRGRCWSTRSSAPCGT